MDRLTKRDKLIIGLSLYFTIMLCFAILLIQKPKEDEVMEFQVGLHIVDGTYKFTLYMPSEKPLNEVHFRFLKINLSGPSTASVVGPDGEAVPLNGTLDEVLHSPAMRESAFNSGWPNSTYGDHFFADHPKGENNLTLFIVFIDSDKDGKASTGDVIWGRSLEQGGGIGYLPNEDIVLTMHVDHTSWGVAGNLPNVGDI